MFLNLIFLKSLAKLTEGGCYQYLPENQAWLSLPIRAEPWGFGVVNFMCKMVAFEELPSIFPSFTEEKQVEFSLAYSILILIMGNSITGSFRLVVDHPGGWLVQPQLAHELGKVSHDLVWSNFKCLQKWSFCCISGQHVSGFDHPLTVEIISIYLIEISHIQISVCCLLFLSSKKNLVPWHLCNTPLGS